LIVHNGFCIVNVIYVVKIYNLTLT